MSSNPNQWPKTLWSECRYSKDEEYGSHLFRFMTGRSIGWCGAVFLVLVFGVFHSVTLTGALVLFERSESWFSPDEAGAAEKAHSLQDLWQMNLLTPMAVIRSIRGSHELAWYVKCACVLFVVTAAIDTLRLLNARMSGSGQRHFTSWAFWEHVAVRGIAQPAYIMIVTPIITVVLFVGQAFCISNDSFGEFGTFFGLAMLCTYSVLTLVFLFLYVPDTAEVTVRRSAYLVTALSRRQPPSRGQIERALRCACEARINGWREWIGILERFDAARSDDADTHVARLGNPDWMERLVGAHLLIAQGGEVCSRLDELRTQANEHIRLAASWVLERIANDTAREVRPDISSLICPEHLVRPARRYARAMRQTQKDQWQEVKVTYIGCRACGRSRDLGTWPGKVVAVLDAGMEDPLVEQGSQLRVNWLSRRAQFDFDRVEIVDATDADVERFVIQIGNDTDPVRLPRYRKMVCSIDARCDLSEVTKRVLRHTFGRVRQRK